MVKKSKFKKMAKHNVAMYKKLLALDAPEKKYAGFDLPSIYASIGTSWIETQIVAPTQGSSFAGRIGRRVKITGFEIRGVLTEGSVDSIADDLYNTVRIIVGEYKGGSTTPLTDATAVINSPIEKCISTKGRLIRKFYDKYIALGTQGAGASGYCPQTKAITIRKFFKKPIVQNFGDDSATYPDKQLILSMASDSFGVPNPGFTVGYFRVWYTDV